MNPEHRMRSNRSRLRAAGAGPIFLALFAIIACPLLSFGDTSWTGAVDNDWQVAGNWDNGLPVAGQRAFISAGNVQLSSGTAAAGNILLKNSRTLSVSGGALLEASRLDIGFASDGTMSVTGNGTVVKATSLSLVDIDIGVGSNSTMTIGDGALVQTATGPLSYTVLLGDSGGNGTLNLNGSASGRGTLAAGGIAKGNAGSINFDGGRLVALKNNGGFVSGFSTGDITINSGGAFIDTNGFNITIASPMRGIGSLTKEGSGTLTLSGANTYSGSTTIHAGVLSLASGGTLGAGSVDIGDTARLHSTDTRTLFQTINFTAGCVGTVSAASGQTLTLAGNIFLNAGATAVFGSAGNDGTILFSPTSFGHSASAAVRVAAGTLLAGEYLAAFTGGSSQTTIDAGATLDFNGQSGAHAQIKNLQGAGTLKNSAGMQIESGDFSGVISGAASLTKLSNDSLVLSGNNTYTGGTVISAGTLQIGNGGTSGSITGNVENSGTLAFHRSDDISFSGLISGTGSLSKLGGNTLTLTSNNTYSGGTTISAGTLRIGNGGTSGSIAGDVSNSGTLSFDRSDDSSFTGAISGAGTVVKQGSGTLTLSGNSTFSGGTTVNAGTLVVASNGALGAPAFASAGTVDGASSVVRINSGITLGKSFMALNQATVDNRGTLNGMFGVQSYGSTGAQVINTGTINASFGDAVYVQDGLGYVTNTGGTLKGSGGSGSSGAYLRDGGSVVNDAGGLITSTGDSAITAGDLISGNSSTNTTDILNKGSSTIQGRTYGIELYSGGNITNEAGSSIIGQTRSGILYSGGNGTITNYGTITGNATSTRAGVQLSGNATTSATVINYGTINGGISSNNFANTIALFTGSVVNNKLNLGTNTATVLRLDGTGTQLYSTAVTGNTTFYGQLKKAGSGSWTLDQNLLNAASTEVQAGTLKVNSSLAGGVTVKNGGTLGGNGTIRGAVSVENGAVLAAGNSPGKLTVGSLTLASSSHTQFELGSPSGTPGVDSDLIDVVSGLSGSTGNLTLGGIFDLITDASFGTGSYRLFDYDGTLTGGNSDILFGQAKAGYALTINTSTPGSVFLDVTQDGLQFWDDSQTSPDHTIAGGSGTWNSSSTNWTNAGGNYNGAWDNLTAVFAGASGGTVTLDETVGVAGLQFGNHDYTLTGNGTITLLSAVTSVLVDGVTATIGVVIDGAAKILSKTGDGALVLTANNTYTGGTTITAGTLQIGAGGTSGWITGDVSNSGTLTFNRSDDITFGGLISGTGSVDKLGGNTLTLTANNTYSGGTTIAAGTLQIGAGGTSGSIMGNVTNNGTLIFNRSSNASFSGTISGSGSLVKQGTNTLVLSATNTYAGGTTISAGTLSTQNVSSLGTGSVVLNGGSLDPVGKLTISTLTWTGGTIASSLGTSSDWVESTGSLTLMGPGQFVFEAGTGFRNNTAYKILSASNMGIFDPLLIEFVGNSLFTLAPVFSRVGNDLFVTFAGTPNFSGAVLQNSAPVGIPTFADFVVVGSASTGSPTENNTINSLIFQPGSSLSVYNTLTVTSGNFTANGNAQMKGPGTTVVPGTFTKLGNGLLSLFNKLFVNGTAVIRSGGVAVNNMLTASRLTVNQGAWLKGSGIISGDVVNNGTTAPGNSPGTLTVTGNFTQGSGGDLQIELGGPSFFDRLLVGGTASLGGRLSALSFGGYIPEYGDKFAFLQAGSISGNFSTVTTWNPSKFRGRFIQNGGTGTLLIAPASYTLVAKNQNQKSVAKALDSFIPAVDNDKATVSTALDFLNAKQYPSAFGQVMPALHGTMADISIEQAFAQTQMLNQRFSAVRLGAAGFQVLGMKSEPLVHDKDGKNVSDPKDGKAVIRQGVDSRWAAWAMGNGIFAKVTSVDQIPAYRSDSGGVLAGADYRWSDNYSTGLYVGYQGSYGDYGSAGNVRMNSVLFGGYATFHMGGFYADAVVGGGATNYKVTRSISFSTINRSANSQQNGGQFSSALNLGYDWQAGGFTFGPIAGAQYTFVGIAPFTETGAQSLDLAVAGQEANSLRSTLGGRVAYTWKANRWLTVIPEARMFWQHEFLNNARAIGASLDGGNGAGFDFWTPEPFRDSVFAGAGVSTQIGKNLNASLYYNANFGRQNYVGQMVSAGFNWDF